MLIEQKILITAALLYANGPLHFGHLAGAYLPADIYARFCRMQGKDVCFLSGSDEYGVAITLSAEMAGRTPQQQIDLFHNMNIELFQRLNISFDHFSRTTHKNHAQFVQEFFLDLEREGMMEKRATEQLYSEQEGRFLADRYVIGGCPKCHYDQARGDECPSCGASFDAMELKDPRSKMTGSRLTLKETTHWFFRLDLMKEKLLQWIETKEWKESVINFVRPYIEELHPRAITRDFDWGVPMPLAEAEDKVFYVWFDAVLGYISGTREWAELRGEPERWKDYWLDDRTKYVQFIGKDNISFHAIFFPAMILAQKTPYKLVDDLPANEFLNLEGKQFSKSSGWFIDLADFLDRYPADTIRYTLAANAPETGDSEFTWDDFQMRVNSELVGKFGNFIHRTLTFLHNQMDGKIPECLHYDDDDNEFLERMQLLAIDIHQAYDHYRVRKATTLFMEMAALANTYFDHKKPWALLKAKERADALNTTMYCCLTACKYLALIAFPIIPETADRIFALLGYQGSLASRRWHTALEEELVPGTPLHHPQILFTKIEDATIAREKSQLKQVDGLEGEKVNLQEAIKIDDFSRVDLRVGCIESAEKVPKSDKLLRLIVNLGFEKRQIVSGIAKHYTDPAQLIGQRVVVVANLKPAKLMGIESQGMILAAGDDAFLELPALKNAPVGTRVT